MDDLNSLQSTIQDLKEIVQRNQGENHETVRLVRQMEQIVADIERKTAKRQTISSIVVSPAVQPVPVL